MVLRSEFFRDVWFKTRYKKRFQKLMAHYASMISLDGKNAQLEDFRFYYKENLINPASTALEVVFSPRLCERGVIT
jgi:hypothetical protein